MKSKLLLKLGLVLIAVSAAILAACGTTMGSAAPVEPPKAVPSSFCLVAKPIYWSTNDTDDTIKQVKEHNAVYKRLCPPVETR